MIYLNMEMPEICEECRFLNVLDDYRCMVFPKEQASAYVDIAVEKHQIEKTCPLKKIKQNKVGKEVSYSPPKGHGFSG